MLQLKEVKLFTPYRYESGNPSGDYMVIGVFPVKSGGYKYACISIDKEGYFYIEDTPTTEEELVIKGCNKRLFIEAMLDKSFISAGGEGHILFSIGIGKDCRTNRLCDL